MNTPMHTYAFNALMANNYVLIHLHFFCSVCVQFSFFLSFFLSIGDGGAVVVVRFTPLSCVMRQWANRRTCTYAMNAFSLREHLMLMHTTNIKENGLTRFFIAAAAAVTVAAPRFIFFSKRET